jgi:hypothetical protein
MPRRKVVKSHPSQLEPMILDPARNTRSSGSWRLNFKSIVSNHLRPTSPLPIVSRRYRVNLKPSEYV